MRRSSIALALTVAVACQRATYLPVGTLRQVAPQCGTYAIAPRPGDRGPTYFGCQVDRAAEPSADRPLAYPLLLADNNVEGEVLLQFAVDERGRVDSTTIRALASSHDLFLRAAREALLGWHARPAERHGRPVRQITTHAFCFKVGGTGALARCAQDLARHSAPAMSVACTDGGRTVADSHGGVQHIAARRPPNVRCT